MMLGYPFRMHRVGLFFFCLWLGVAGGNAAQARPVISAVKVQITKDGQETIQLQANAPLKVVKQFALSNPDRIVVDVASAEGKNLSLPKDYQGSLIRNVRYGQFNASVSRLVIETDQSASVLSTQPQPHGLAIQLVPSKNAQGFSAKVPPAVSAKTKPTVKPPVASQPPAPTAEEKKPLIVLDAGHGGQDPGASGIHQVQEKHITLAMVKAIRDGLLATGRYRVLLTRGDDRYILLPERVEIARRAKANLFISIHADSNPNDDARGLSIYSVSEVASDKESAALAERENKSDVIGGLDLNTADKDVANILIDLTQHETATKSLELADALVASMDKKVTLLPGTPHRFAGFRVLKAPDIPSVLIELGFLTNATDEKLLQTDAYRDLVANSVIRGIDRYRAEQKK